MTIDSTVVEILIPALTGLVSATIAALVTFVTTRRTSYIEERVAVIEGYNKLCAAYQDALDLNNNEIARLRKQLNELEESFEATKLAWYCERTELQTRIDKLEKHNKQLKTELEEYKQKMEEVK